MKSDLAQKLKARNLKAYLQPDNKYLVFCKGKEFGVGYTERDLARLVEDWNKPLTKPRLSCKSGAGCPCCDYPRQLIKEHDKRAHRREGKKIGPENY